jgi:hypothetical protein
MNDFMKRVYPTDPARLGRARYHSVVGAETQPRCKRVANAAWPAPSVNATITLVRSLS